MSRPMLLMGLLISAAGHAWLLSLQGTSAPPTPTAKTFATAQMVEQPPEPKAPSSANADAATGDSGDEPNSPSSTRPIKPNRRGEETPSPDSPRKTAPQTPLHQTAQTPTTKQKKPGDFAGSNNDDAPRMPRVRIDWGSPTQAMRFVQQAGIKLVVLGAGGNRFSREVHLREGQYRLRPFRSEAGVRYANRLRVVHDVPAFRQVRQDLDLEAGNRIALLLPVAIDRQIQSAITRAAYAEGVLVPELQAVGLRLLHGADEPSFRVTQITPRS